MNTKTKWIYFKIKEYKTHLLKTSDYISGYGSRTSGGFSEDISVRTDNFVENGYQRTTFIQY